MPQEIEHEVVSLRNEQTERIKTRDQLVYLNIVAVGLLFSKSLERTEVNEKPLLVVPWVALSLGWVFVVNDLKIFKLSLYLSESAKSQDGAPVGWEHFRRLSTHRLLEGGVAALMIQLSVFALPALASMILFAAQAHPWSRGDVLLAVPNLVLLAVLVFGFVSAANYRKQFRSPASSSSKSSTSQVAS